MRTTLTIDDELATLLKRRAAETGRPFKVVVNEALRLGLESGGAIPSPRSYQVAPVSLGTPQADVDLTKALDLAGALEDEEIARELLLRR